MIIEYLRYTIASDRADDFIEAYTSASEPLMASTWCMSFNMARCVEDPTQFILRIEWTSADDHMRRFRTSDEFRAFFALIKPYVKAIDEMRHYEPLVAKQAPELL